MSLVDLLETFLGRKKVLDNNYRIEDDSEYESEFKVKMRHNITIILHIYYLITYFYY